MLKCKSVLVLSLVMILTFSMVATAVEVDIFQFKVEVKEALEDAADLYMEKNPDIEINIQTVGGGDDYGAALKARFASGNEPAIFNIGGPQDVEDWMADLEDLSDQPWVDLAFKGVLGGVTVDDEVYGLPFNQEGYGFIYNKAIFKEAGIDPASIDTYEKLSDAVQTLDKNKKNLGIKAVFAFPAKETWVTGMHLANVVFANEFDNVIEAYEADEIEFKYSEQLKELVDLQATYGYKPAGTRSSLNAVDYSTQVEELFSLEQVAIIQQGNWAYGTVASMDENLAKNIGLLPIPVNGVVEDSIPVGIPMYWCVNNGKSKEVKDAAKAFLNWLYTSPEGKDIVVNDFNFIPALKGYEGENLKASDPLARDILAYSNEGNTMPWVFMGMPAGWAMDVLGSNIQSYLAGDMTWDELVEDAKVEWAEAR